MFESFFQNRFSFLDAKKQEALDELNDSLKETRPVPERTIMQLEVRDITTINYHPNLLNFDFICTCMKCGKKWQSLVNEFKMSKLDVLIVYCTDCFKPPKNLIGLPTLKSIENRFKRENKWS